MMQTDNIKVLFSDFSPISYEQWKEKVIQDLKGADFDKSLLWKSEEGFILLPYYNKEKVQELEYLDSFKHSSVNDSSAAGTGRYWANSQNIQANATKILR